MTPDFGKEMKVPVQLNPGIEALKSEIRLTSFPLNLRGGGHIDIKGSSNQHLAPAARSQPLHMSPRGDCHRHDAQRLRNRASLLRPVIEGTEAGMGRGVSRAPLSRHSGHTPHACQQG